MTDVSSSSSPKKNELEEAYLVECARLHLEPDPSVLVTLSTRWDVLAPSFHFGEGQMLPLLGVLSSKKCSVVRLVLRTSEAAHRSGAWSGERVSCDARVLAQALTRNESIKELDVASCGLRDLGVQELARAIETSQLEKLDLRRNAFGAQGCAALVEAVGRGKDRGECGLQVLDVGMNGLGYTTVKRMRANLQGLQLHIDQGNYTTEEVLNAVTHGIGCALALVGSVPLLSDASRRDRATFYMCLVYSASLVLCFASSAAYHACFQLPRAFRLLQRMDHVAIYLLIAGSYTPFMGIGMRGHLGALAILVLVWIAAGLGTLVSAAGVGLDTQDINPLEVTVYACMGLAVVPVINDVHDAYPAPAFGLLVLGGAAYLVGIIFFVAGAKHPMLHVVWHGFVLTGAFVHWFAIYLYIIPMLERGQGEQRTDHVLREHLIDAQQALASLIVTRLHQTSAYKRAANLLHDILNDRNFTSTLVLPSLLASFSSAYRGGVDENTGGTPSSSWHNHQIVDDPVASTPSDDPY